MPVTGTDRGEPVLEGVDVIWEMGARPRLVDGVSGIRRCMSLVVANLGCSIHPYCQWTLTELPVELTRVSLRDLRSGLFELLADEHAVVIAEVPTGSNACLMNLGGRLGEYSDEGITSTTNYREDRYIHFVNERATPSLDPYGNTMISTTNEFFPLHTDEYFARCPARYVFLLCVHAGTNGGESRVSKVEDIARLLSQRTLSTLAEPVYPSQAGLVRLFFHIQDQWSIRFNEIEMDRAVLGGFAPPVPKEARSAVEELKGAAEQAATQHLLRPGDCLIVRNDRALHGRLAFPSGSGRLFKRLRVR